MLDGRRRACGESNSEDSEARRVGEDVDGDVEEVVDEEEADTDLETDRLLGQQRTDDQGFYDDKVTKIQILRMKSKKRKNTKTIFFFFSFLHFSLHLVINEIRNYLLVLF